MVLLPFFKFKEVREPTSLHLNEVNFGQLEISIFLIPEPEQSRLINSLFLERSNAVNVGFEQIRLFNAILLVTSKFVIGLYEL
ncbi:hypothetical protein D3C87_1412830 [compost metagenome]